LILLGQPLGLVVLCGKKKEVFARIKKFLRHWTNLSNIK
jgi:hypothetical protein